MCRGKGHHLGHRVMGQACLFHLAGSDLFATPVDQLLDAPGQIQIALGIDIALVSGTKPRTIKRAGIGLNGRHIFLDDTGAADHHLTHLPRRHIHAPFLHDAHLWTCRQSHRTRLARLGRQRVGGHLMGSLGHAIGFDHGTVKSLLQGCQYRGRQCGRRRAHQTQCRVPYRLLIARCPGHDELMHGGYGAVIGGLGPLEVGKEGQCVETLTHIDAAASQQRRQQTGHQAMNMEKGHDVERAILGRQRQCLADLACRGQQLAVGQTHQLGASRGARGMQQQGFGIFWRAACCGLACTPLSAGLQAALATRALQQEHRHTAMGCRGQGTRLALCGHQGAHTEILQIKAQFGFCIGGVQGGSPCMLHDRQQAQGKVAALGHHCHTIAAGECTHGGTQRLQGETQRIMTHVTTAIEERWGRPANQGIGHHHCHHFPPADLAMPPLGKAAIYVLYPVSSRTEAKTSRQASKARAMPENTARHRKHT